MYFPHLSFTVTKSAGLFQLAKMRTRSLLKQIAFYTHSNENVELSNSELQSLLFLQPSYPDTNCLLFDFSKNKSLNEKRLIQIRFNFKQTDNLDTTALVRIVDRIPVGTWGKHKKRRCQRPQCHLLCCRILLSHQLILHIRCMCLHALLGDCPHRRLWCCSLRSPC